MLFRLQVKLSQFMDENNPNERDLALFVDLVVMGKCQEVWVFGDKNLQRHGDRDCKSNQTQAKDKIFQSRLQGEKTK